MRRVAQVTKKERAKKARSRLAYRDKAIADTLSRAVVKLARIETIVANMEVFMQNHFEYFYPRPTHFKDHKHDLSSPAGEHSPNMVRKFKPGS